MRISDWSSDVCSSDLVRGVYGLRGEENARCAIFSLGEVEVEHFVRFGFRCVRIGRAAHCPPPGKHACVARLLQAQLRHIGRSAESRVGEGCVSKCRSRWATHDKTKKQTEETI